MPMQAVPRFPNILYTFRAGKPRPYSKVIFMYCCKKDLLIVLYGVYIVRVICLR